MYLWPGRFNQKTPRSNRRHGEFALPSAQEHRKREHLRRKGFRDGKITRFCTETGEDRLLMKRDGIMQPRRYFLRFQVLLKPRRGASSGSHRDDRHGGRTASPRDGHMRHPAEQRIIEGGMPPSGIGPPGEVFQLHAEDCACNPSIR